MEQESQSLPKEAQGPAKKRTRATWWDRVETLGDSMEWGLRALRGCLFVFLISGIAWGLGSQVWTGVGILMAIVVAPFAFLIGVFWDEVKLMLWLLRKIVFGL